MQNLFIEFLPPWVETGLQPAFYDKESGTVLQQTARMYAKLNELIKDFNSLYNYFVELKEYVYDYFDNMDVQEEINNKLDDMAESGELADVIAQYLDLACVITFDTYAQLKASENVVEGSTVMTLGYSSYSDGKTEFYKIRAIKNTDTVDEVNLVSLTNYPSLVAERVNNYYTEYNLQFHAIKTASSGYVTIFPNGKVFLYDTGRATEWTSIKETLDNLGVKRIDYLAISHFHTDHDGNIQNICENYDTSSCICWVGMKPDFTNHPTALMESEQDYDDAIALIEGEGLTPIVPTNDSYVDIDEGIKIHFVNTSLQLAEDYNYYTQQHEQYSQLDGKPNFNLFSLVCEIMYGANVITLTGDIESATEQAITQYMHKATYMSMPHHGINKEAFEPFYLATKPEYADFHLSIVADGNDTWVYPYYAGFKYIQQIGSCIIAPAWTKPVNNAFSFYMSRYATKTTLESMVPTTRRVLHVGESFGTVQNFVNYLQADNASVTLSDIIATMKQGDVLTLYWYVDYTTAFPALYQDLQTLCGRIANDDKIKIEKIGESTNAIVTIYRSNSIYTYIMKDFNSTIPTQLGYGVLPDQNTTNKLIDLLKLNPEGIYQMNDFSDTTNIDANHYVASINLIYNDGNDVKASVMLINKSTDSSRSVVYKHGYIDTTATPTYSWK